MQLAVVAARSQLRCQFCATKRHFTIDWRVDNRDQNHVWAPSARSFAARAGLLKVRGQVGLSAGFEDMGDEGDTCSCRDSSTGSSEFPQGVPKWGGRGSNPRPTDYQSP